MPPSGHPSSKTVDSITHQHAFIKEAAGALSLRISQFTKYLATMPGRVDVTAFGRHPEAENDSDSVQLGLRLHRVGQEWNLSYGIRASERSFVANWRLLEEAPLKIKIAAINLFPQLLENIEKSQHAIVDEIARAVSAYDDTIANVLSLPPLPPVGFKTISQGDTFLEAKWAEVMQIMAATSASIPALLSCAQLASVDHRIAVIRMATSETARINILGRNGKIAKLAEAVSTVFGRPTEVRFEVYDPLKPELGIRPFVLPEGEGK